MFWESKKGVAQAESIWDVDNDYCIRVQIAPVEDFIYNEGRTSSVPVLPKSGQPVKDVLKESVIPIAPDANYGGHR